MRHNAFQHTIPAIETTDAALSASPVLVAAAEIEFIAGYIRQNMNKLRFTYRVRQI